MTTDFDVIVYGATGYTGRLVAEYIALTYPAGVRWAMAGRSLSKLEEVRGEMGISADVPLVTANADDPASLRAMCERTKVVISTVGPYQLYGGGVRGNRHGLCRPVRRAGVDAPDDRRA